MCRALTGRAREKAVGRGRVVPTPHDSAALRRRLLLRDAVNVAATEQDFAAWHHDHAMLGEYTLEDGAGFLVLGVSEARRDDAAVDDEEVDVGAGQAVGDMEGNLEHGSRVLLQ